jgi:hypothetical protein
MIVEAAKGSLPVTGHYKTPFVGMCSMAYFAYWRISAR